MHLPNIERINLTSFFVKPVEKYFKKSVWVILI